jgi:chemotaxis protein CheZ
MKDDLMQARERDLVEEVSKVTVILESALKRFCIDSHLADLAEKAIPDARARLERVLQMTDEAAHRTLDLIEDSTRPAERIRQGVEALKPLLDTRTARDTESVRERSMGFIEGALEDAGRVRQNLKELLIAQEYQDLSGQIIRSVIGLISEVEEALGVLVSLTRGVEKSEAGETPAPSARGSGTVGSETVTGQGEIDSLLSSLNI